MKNIKTYEEYYKGQTLENYLNNFHKNEDLSKNTDFNCVGLKLIDLKGIERLINLESFFCRDNRLTSLKGIEKLKNLNSFGFSDNKITSLDELENLTKLEKIFFTNNLISSLEPLKNLSNLRILNCNENKITSLKPILNLTNLQSLDCDKNKIDWIDYIDKKGNTWYIKLPKSINLLISSEFSAIEDYWEFIDKNQPVAVSRKFNF